ncbi:phospholipase A2 inhibitor and Ly6/PLAUR domain-containing protein-like [Ambystoma mexicanum]|uniref:phospholipase A2 inhibitor and Ly6/PLAUR domain-containing protein-like n=1 Tax=Ambystoma mexicanum TaxID=8296 RepID=UPI0037E7E811
MKPSLCIASILFAVLAEGNALRCQQCISATGTQCAGDLQTCPPGADACVTAYSTTTMAGIDMNMFMRRCGLLADCQETGSIVNPLMSLRASSSCCTTDGCTSAVKPVPPVSSQPNGLVCRACFDATSTSCHSEDTIQCTGKETKCIRYAGTTTAGSQISKIALRGCATPSICTGKKVTSIGGLTVEAELVCTDSSNRLGRGIFLPVLTGLLLLKLFFI